MRKRAGFYSELHLVRILAALQLEQRLEVFADEYAIGVLLDGGEKLRVDRLLVLLPLGAHCVGLREKYMAAYGSGSIAQK